MSLVFQIAHPRSPTSPGNTIDIGNEAVRLNGVELVYAAAIGESAATVTEIDDPTGTLDVTGMWSYVVAENSLPSNTAIHYGLVGDRTYTRDKGDALLVGPARKIRMESTDFNALLGFRQLEEDDDADRPAETADARLRWLIANSYAPFHDHGNVTYPTHAMDATNYAGQTFRDVLADIAAPVNYNFWIWPRPSDGQVSLYFFDANTSTNYGSPLRISNVMADVTADATGWTYYPYVDAEGTMSPARVASGVRVPYQNGAVFVRSQSTASNFNFRDLTAPMANIASASAATAVAAEYLAHAASEDFTVKVEVRVPVSTLSQIMPGHRMTAKFSHFDAPYNDWTWYRIMRRTIIQDEGTVETVKLRLELSPQEVVASSDYTGTVFAGVLRSDTVSGARGYAFTQASPPSGWDGQAVVGPISLNQSEAPYTSFTVTEPMTVRLNARAQLSMVSGGSTQYSLVIQVNGVTVGSDAQTEPGGLAFWAPTFEVDVRDHHLDAGDVVGIVMGPATGWTNFLTNDTYFRVGRGTFVWDATSWEGP